MIRAGVPAVSHSSAPVPSEASARPMTLPPLAVGEITTAEIVGSGPDRHVLVALKGGRLLAEAGLPLRVGERLTVRVDRLYPTVLVRVLEAAAGGKIQTAERLRIPSSQPDALLKLFDITAVLPDAGVLPDAVKKTLTAFNERLRSLVLSDRTPEIPAF